MAFQQRARREQAKLRLAIDGLAGTGKTFTSILIASIMAELMRPRLGHRGKVGVIDTEHESASLFAMTDDQADAYAELSGDEAIAYLVQNQAFDFYPMPLDNHSPRAYVEGIKEAEEKNVDVLVIDSLSHAWAGKNGALEQKDMAFAMGGTSQYTAWRSVTPQHNQLVDSMLSCKMHLIATMRRKMEYLQTERDGKKVIDKVGLQAIQREGMEYEFTIVGDMDHRHSMTISKHRTTGGVLDNGDVFEMPGEKFTRKLYGWLTAGSVPSTRPAQPQPRQTSDGRDLVDGLHALELAGTPEEAKKLLPMLSDLANKYPAHAAVIRERYADKRKPQAVATTADLVDAARTDAARTV